MVRMRAVLYRYKYSTRVCIDICLNLASQYSSDGGSEGRREGGRERKKKQKQLMAEKLIGEESATSREVMKHHRSKLTQLFDCECQSAAPPPPLSPLYIDPPFIAPTRDSGFPQAQTHVFFIVFLFIQRRPTRRQQPTHISHRGALTRGETYKWGNPHISSQDGWEGRGWGGSKSGGWGRGSGVGGAYKNCRRSNRRAAMFSRRCLPRL